MLAVFTTLAVLASSAYAQINISNQCQQTLGGIAASSDAACLNVPGLITQFATLSPNASIVGPLNSWLTGACSQPACTNQTIANIVTNVTTGCASDLAPLGFQSSDTQGLITEIQQFYPIVRDVVCLKNSTSNNLCVTDVLNTVQAATGTISENNIVNVVGNIINGGFSNNSISRQVVCSNCVKAAINVINKDAPGLIPSNTLTGLGSVCGSSFTDGQNPSDVTQTASGATAGNNTASGALASFPLTSITFSLGGLATAFALFA